MRYRLSVVPSLAVVLGLLLAGCAGGTIRGTTGTFSGPVTIGGDVDVAGGGLFGVTTIVNGSSGAFLVNNTRNKASNMALTDTGNVKFRGTISGSNKSGNPSSFVAPVYSPAGDAVESTLHGVTGRCSTSGAESCTVKFSGAAVFANPRSYACTYDYASGSPSVSGRVLNLSGAKVAFITPGYAGTVSFTCMGT